MNITIFESGLITNPVFGSAYTSPFKIVLAVGIDDTATADVVFESGEIKTGIPINALINGNARLKQITTATVAATSIWIGLQ